MAAFNPELPPENATNFTSMVWQGRTIPQPASDLSKGTALESYGKGLESGVKAVDDIFKNKIEGELHPQIDAAKDDFTTALNSYKSATMGLTPSEATQAKTMNLLSPNAEDTNIKVPDALSSSLRTVGQLQGGLGSGKVSETYYYGQLNSIAKQMRSQYPGYRDYIDQKISDMTGVNPANAYLKSIVEDIDRSATSKQAMDKEMFNTMVNLSKEGVDGMGLVWQNYSAGKYGQGQQAASKVMDIIAEKQKDVYGARVAENKLKGAKSGEELNALIAGPGATQWVNDKVKTAMSMDMTHGEGVSPDQLFQTIQDHLSGTHVIPNFDQLMQTRGQQLQLLINQQRQQAVDHYSQHAPGERSIMDIVGQEPMRAKIEAALQPMKDYADQMSKGAFATALFVHNQTQALGSQDRYQMLTAKGPDGKPLPITEALRKTNAIKDILGPGLGQNFQINQLLQGNMMEQLKGLKMDAFGINGKPESAQAHVDTILDKLPKDPATGAPIGGPENIKDYMRVYDYLKDPKAPDDAKIRLAQTMFAAGNWDFMLRFKGAPTQQKMFTDVLNPDTLSSLYRLNDNTTWNNVKDWASVTMNRYIMPEELANFKQFSGMEGAVKFAYNTDSHSWTPQFNVNDRIVQSNPAFMPAVQQTVKRLNAEMAVMARLAQTEKSDPDAMILDLFKNANVDLSNPTLAGIPGQLLQAIATARNAGRPYRQGDGTADPFNNTTNTKNEDRRFAK